MRFSLLILLIFWQLCGELAGQTFATRADSLEQLLTQERSSTEQIDLLLETAKSFQTQDANKYNQYASQALELSKEIRDKKRIAQSLVLVGVGYRMKSNYGEAASYYIKALDTFEELGDRLGMADTYGKIGIIYQRRVFRDGNNEYLKKSVSQFEKAAQIWEEEEEDLQLASTYLSLADTYGFDSTYKDETVKIYQKGIEICKKYPPNKTYAGLMIRLAAQRQTAGEWEKAEVIYKKLRKIEFKGSQMYQ
ncbi:MAG: tetratricopeptide repeat protein, partial [Bacteroidota bacterium]